MEKWTRQYPNGSHTRILFDPASPLEADLDDEWSVATFSLPIGFAVVAVFFFVGLGAVAGPGGGGVAPAALNRPRQWGVLRAATTSGAAAGCFVFFFLMRRGA